MRRDWSNRPLRVLMLYYHPDEIGRTRPAFLRHLRVLTYSDGPHELTYHNVFEHAPYWIGANEPDADGGMDRLRDEPFDAVILHYSFLSIRTVGSPFFDWKRRFGWIADLPCPKIALPMDEGDCHEILDEWLLELDASVIFSVHHREERPLYRLMRHRARIMPCLPGYVDLDIGDAGGAPRPPIAQRPRDIVYRARRLPYRFGRAGQLKHRIADVFLEHATDAVLDISTNSEDAIFGDAWMEFLASSRAVLGVEGGYSAIDWRGEVKARVSAILRENPNLSFEDVSARMPPGWDDYDLLTITPRHFEAALARTAQVLIEGDYRGILVPDRHYIPVRPDFSNVDEVFDRIRDHRALQEMVDRTYAELCESDRYTYAAFAREIESAIRREIAGEAGTRLPSAEEARAPA